MKDQIALRFQVHDVEALSYAPALRALGVRARQVYTLRERIDCSHWKHVSEHFLRPTPRRYVTLQPEKVIAAMQQQGLW